LNSTTSTSKNNPAWLVKMAMRDARASVSRLLLFMASIILGIAAVVSIQLFGENLKNNIKTQSKALMGADYIIDTRQEPNDRVQAIIDSLGPDAYEVNFSTMVSFPSNGATKLVRVRGMKGNFPFYGSIDTKPVSASRNYQQEGGALVDATLMLQYDIKPGDSIKVGMVTLPVIGALYAIPGSTAISSSVAPPVVIPYRFIEQTGLLQFGSRKEYQYFFRAPDTDLDQLDKTLDPVLDAENADLDTHTSTSRRLGRRYENVGKFLNLTAFIALLLGCIGIASSVNIYIREKLPSVAVLKCLGATRKQSFVIFLLQIAGIGLIGGITGTAIGASGFDHRMFRSDGPLARRWWMWLAGGLMFFVVFIIMIAVVSVGDRNVVSEIAFAVCCGATVFGMTGLFLRLAKRRVRIFDSLSDNAYGIYIVHYVFVIWLQYLLLGSTLAPTVKAIAVFLCTLILSWSVAAAIRRIPSAAKVI